MTDMARRRGGGRLVVLSVLAALGAGPGVARAEVPAGRVIWMHSNFPPVSISQGPQRGQGIGDRMRQWLRDRLPGFAHETVMVETFEFIPYWRRALAGEACCTVDAFRTPQRAEVTVASRPILMVAPVELVLEEARLDAIRPALDAAGRVDLAALFDRTAMVLGVIDGRAYAPAIDPVLALQVPARRVVARGGANQMQGLLDMLRMQRVDAVFGYGFEIAWLRRPNESAGRFRALPVAGMPGLIPSSLRCSRTDVGRQVVAAVDALVAAGELRPVFAEHFAAWLDGEARRRYRRDAPGALAGADARPDSW